MKWNAPSSTDTRLNYFRLLLEFFQADAAQGQVSTPRMRRQFFSETWMSSKAKSWNVLRETQFRIRVVRWRRAVNGDSIGIYGQ